MGKISKKIKKTVKNVFNTAASVATLGIVDDLTGSSSQGYGSPDVSASAASVAPPDAEKGVGDDDATTESGKRNTRRRGKAALTVRRSGSGLSV